MLKNYLKIALRNILRHKAYSFITIVGLAVAMTSALLVFAHMLDELSYDRFYQNADRIYRVCSTVRLHGFDFSSSMAPPPLADALVREVPEVKAAVRLWNSTNMGVTGIAEDGTKKTFYERNVCEADPGFFDVFGLRLLAGDSATALVKPETVVITEEMAKKYFGEEAYKNGRVLGKPLYMHFPWGGGRPYKVTGIVQSMPRNSHFHFDILWSAISDRDSVSQSWVNNTYYTYVVLNEKGSPQALEAKLPLIVQKHLDPQLLQRYGYTHETLRKQGGEWGYFLQPVTDIHLRSNYERELEANGSITIVWILFTIGVFIVVIACINYTNLVTARYSARAKEVGIRKVLGSTTNALKWQFLCESGTICFLAACLAIALAALLLPTFNYLAGKQLSLAVFLQPQYAAMLVVLFLITGLLGGFYPAFYLSSFQPAAALKGKVSAGVRSGQLRRILITFQFAISIALIICSVVVHRQLNYLREMNPGFDKKNMVVISDAAAKMARQYEAFRQEVMKSGKVINVCASGTVPGGGEYMDPLLTRSERETDDHLILRIVVSYDFLKTYGLQLLEGREFSRDFNDANSENVILTESAVKELNLKNPIGQMITQHEIHVAERLMRRKVVGVIKDFNYESFHKPIRPLVLAVEDDRAFISVRVRPDGVPQTLETIRQKWSEFVPEFPMEYSFLDEMYDALYRAEERLSKVVSLFTTLAIIIACLGLFGLASFMAEQRTKEIGVRKVLGASLIGIVALLTKEFTKWVLLANLIAWPVAWYAMHQWLDNYAYRTSVDLWIFFAAGAAGLLISLLTVSLKAIHTAQANPIEALRYE